MYYYIKGKFILKGDNFVVIEANGVGYKIFTSSINISQITSTSDTVTMYTHFHVREDTQELYGFLTNDEISQFVMLLSVSGVGPKAALSIMSVMTFEQFSLAVITGDAKAITKAQGIGPKVAQRIVLELKDKVKTTDAMSTETKEIVIENDNNISEAITALVVLGYSANEAKKAVDGVDTTKSVEEIIKQALKQLTK